jgi:carbonic anhydrase
MKLFILIIIVNFSFGIDSEIEIATDNIKIEIASDNITAVSASKDDLLITSNSNTNVLITKKGESLQNSTESGICTFVTKWNKYYCLTQFHADVFSTCSVQDNICQIEMLKQN